MTFEEHLDNLTRHIHLVRSACSMLGKRLVNAGRVEFGRNLIARGFAHDQSKFHGIEWDYLHQGDDIDKTKLWDAIKQHVATNDHHPEFHGGIDNMPEIAIAEMCCDWYARSQEFGKDLREWIRKEAFKKYKFNYRTQEGKWVKNFVNLLLKDYFAKKEKP
jgi:hypothetical protein